MNQKNQTVEFLEAIFSGYFKEQDGYIEIRIIGKDNGIADSIFLRPKDLNDELLAEIRELNEDCHIYFGVNPRPLSKGKKDSDITVVICLWSDLDGKDFENGKEDAQKKVDEFPLSPTCIVDSGHGLHCYWILEEPIIGISEEDKLALKQTLSGLANKLEADKHPIFLSALLRLPGTINIKSDEQTECKVVHLDIEKKYQLDDFKEFKNIEYREPKLRTDISLDFGSKHRIISTKKPGAAIADVQRLEVDLKVKRRIITGNSLTCPRSMYHPVVTLFKPFCLGCRRLIA